VVYYLAGLCCHKPARPGGWSRAAASVAGPPAASSGAGQKKKVPPPGCSLALSVLPINLDKLTSRLEIASPKPVPPYYGWWRCQPAKGLKQACPLLIGHPMLCISSPSKRTTAASVF